MALKVVKKYVDETLIGAEALNGEKSNPSKVGYTQILGGES